VGMGGGEDFFGRDIGQADHAVFGRGGAAAPFMTVCQSDG
jgi:hypothetical protein